MIKFLSAIGAVIILNVLPLLSQPELIISYKAIIVIIEGFCLWLTQPKFSLRETRSNKKTDKLSIVFILLASSLSVVSAEIEWAYFNYPYKDLNILAFCGLTMIITGLALRIWSILSLGKHFTATVRLHNEHELMQNGPYAILRHPSYTGAFFAITGVAFFLNAAISIFISIVVMFIAYYIRIKTEEKLLTSYFGDAYIAYSKNKKKLFPYVW